MNTVSKIPHNQTKTHLFLIFFKKEYSDKGSVKKCLYFDFRAVFKKAEVA